MNFYSNTSEEIASKLNTDLKRGLTAEEASRRLKEQGSNVIPVEKPDSYLKIFLKQFKSPLIYILLVAAVIIFFMESRRDAFFISFVLLLNAFVGTYQEGKSGNILASLKKLITTYCVVIRGGARKIISSKELVVGDLVVLQQGDQVPADCRLVLANNLGVDESRLTGESLPVSKILKKITWDKETEMPFFEQKNMIFNGTYIVRGNAVAVVVATAASTAIGKLKKLVGTIDTKIPLMVDIERISYMVLWIVTLTCLSLFVLGFLTGRDINSLVTMLMALFICVVPEGLPVIVTLVLVMGVARMAKKNVLVKRLAAVEGLGKVDVVAVDKTGTLTKNEMAVNKLIVDGEIVDAEQGNKLLAFVAALMSNAQVGSDKRILGDPTEAALTLFGLKNGFDKQALEKQLKIFKNLPFSSEHKLNLIFISGDCPEVGFSSNDLHFFALGAPETICDLTVCGDKAHEHLNYLLKEGFRVVSLAHKKMTLAEWGEYEKSFFRANGYAKDIYSEGLKGLSFSAMYAMRDTIRPNVKSTIEYVKQNGVQVIMITGDHLATAEVVARESGILQKNSLSMLGEEFDKEAPEDVLDKTVVYARVTPQKKLDIIQAYRNRGNIVAMTGDGVNDAPSLAVADLGISMGIIGTEVAKEASDIVLLDDSFKSIVAGIEEGRNIFHILKRVILYFFSTNMAEILIVLFALAAGFPLPLLAIQILWLNLITDGFLNLALTMEPKDKLPLQKRVFGGVAFLIDRGLILRMLFMSLPMALGSLSMFNAYAYEGVVKARTITFITMALFQLFNVWNCRSKKDSVFVGGFFTNKYLLAVSCFVFFLQVSIVYFKPLQVLFHTVVLSMFDWFLILVVSSLVIWVEEIRKLYARRNTI